MSLAEIRDVLHTPYQLEGRVVGVAIDCLGVVREMARRRRLPPPDGWPAIKEAWERGEIDTATGFPAGWCRQPVGATIRDDDVLLFHHGEHPWCAFVFDGFVVSASPKSGPYARSLARWLTTPSEVWRYSP